VYVLFTKQLKRLQTFNKLSKMSSSTKTSSVAVATSNKLVYIARIEGKYTERDVCDIIADARIGRVMYVDFTAVKDNSADAGPNPAFKFYSAFVMMSEWNPHALEDLTKSGYLKVWTDSRRISYFMLRQAKEGSEIPRTKVNIHQLAAYTAELYEKVGASDTKVELANQKAEIAEKKSELAVQKAELATKNMELAEKKMELAEMKAELADQKISEMMEVMNEMASKMTLMSKQIAYMDGFLMSRFAVTEEKEEKEEVAVDNL
jgi:hypothetical protein